MIQDIAPAEDEDAIPYVFPVGISEGDGTEEDWRTWVGEGSQRDMLLTPIDDFIFGPFKGPDRHLDEAARRRRRQRWGQFRRSVLCGGGSGGSNGSVAASGSTNHDATSSSSTGLAAGGAGAGAGAGAAWRPRVMLLVVHEGSHDIATGAVFEDVAAVTAHGLRKLGCDVVVRRTLLVVTFARAYLFSPLSHDLL